MNNATPVIECLGLRTMIVIDSMMNRSIRFVSVMNAGRRDGAGDKGNRQRERDRARAHARAARRFVPLLQLQSDPVTFVRFDDCNAVF